MEEFLVRPLFDGPLDIVGDVHGEIDALRSLLRHMGYTENGTNGEGRKLVFLGDLTDRGPDSPAVIDLVRHIVDSKKGQCVLGNHELNILLGRHKRENKWFFGEEFLDKDDNVVPQKLADEAGRRRTLDFFRRLPIALERKDLRAIHACWHEESILIAKEAIDAAALYRRYAAVIEKEVVAFDDDIRKRLEHQNRNPAKVLTSGPERRAETPFKAAGRIRHEERVPWWRDYADEPFCVFGHYALPIEKPHGNGRAFCADYRIGKRWLERREPDFDGQFKKTKLAAMRIPERVVVFDDGSVQVPHGSL